MTTKAGIRRRLRETLRHLTPETVTRVSLSLRAKLTASPAFQQASVIAVFHPTTTEPDLRPLLQLPGKTFLFPLCHRDRTLTWHLPDGLDQWTPSRFGITEPDPALHPAVPADSIGLVLVPGLAFTMEGHRLGHGAGYYDRFLANLPPSVRTAGICFDCQIQTCLPVEPHDIRVHQVFHA